MSDQESERRDAGLRYQPFEAINQMAIFEALTRLDVLADDIYLGSQATNLGIVDHFITELEYRVLRELQETESTPQSTYFLSAQSQMWIFAAYELLRTWRQRAREIVRLVETNTLEQALDTLKAKNAGYMHFGREMRIHQLERAVSDRELTTRLRSQLRHLHIPFARLEHIRISIAKHEIRGKAKQAALMPGYGRINMWCGSLDYELENGHYSMGYINRRDVADSIRALDFTQEPPSEETLKEFDEFMRGRPLDGST